MSDILVILLVIAVLKSIFFGIVLFVVFRDDVAAWWAERRARKPTLTCMWCQSTYLHQLGEEETRWEDGELVLVTTYECDHCRFPMRRVERIGVGSARR